MRLSSRLADPPREFFSSVDPSKADCVHLPAIVSDLCRARVGAPLAPIASQLFEPAPRDKLTLRHHELVLLTCWLLFDEVFQGVSEAGVLSLLLVRLRALAEVAMPRSFVEDPERREELVRTSFAALGLLPRDESPAIADDRLSALDSVKRRAMLAAAKEREEARDKKRREIERLRAQEEEEKRKAARTTFED